MGLNLRAGPAATNPGRSGAVGRLGSLIVYLPGAFAQTDPARLHAFPRAHSFAILSRVEPARLAKLRAHPRPYVRASIRAAWAYTLQAEVVTDAVVGRRDGTTGGVGVGRSGTARDQHLMGTNGRQLLTHRCRVDGNRQEVTFVMELRAMAGEVWFRRDSVRLIRDDPDRLR